MSITRNKIIRTKPATLAESLEQAIAKSNGTTRKKPEQREGRMQTECVKWFRLQYPDLALNLISVPNGGSRNAIEAERLKREGVTAGVADLVLFVPNSTHHCLCMELKYGQQGKQSDTQKEWQIAIEKQNYQYLLIRSIDEFQTEIKNYLKL